VTRQLILTIILTTLSSSVFSICKLNQQGHNICTKEKALYQSTKSTFNSKTIDKKFKSVTVVKHDSIKRTVFIEETVIIQSEYDATKTIETNEVPIDDLVGNQLCENNDDLCKGERVLIKEECSDPKLRNKYKIAEKYENDVIELTTGRIFFSKSFLTLNNCIDIAK
jgi:hypothetical protein